MTGRTEALLQDLQHCLNFLNKAQEQKTKIYGNLMISSVIIIGTIYLGITDPSMIHAIFQELDQKYLKQLQKVELEHQHLLTKRSHLQKMIAHFKHNLFIGSIEKNEIDEHYENLLKKYWYKKNEAYEQWDTSNCLENTPLHLYPYVCHTPKYSSRVQEQSCRTILDSYCQQYAAIEELTYEKELRQYQYASQDHSARFSLDLLINALSRNEQEIKQVINRKEESLNQRDRNDEWLGYTRIVTSAALVLLVLVYTFFYFKTALNTINNSYKFPFTGETERWLQHIGSKIGILNVNQVSEEYFVYKLKRVIQDLNSLSENENSRPPI